jgi:hypothetical protein
LVDVAVGRQIRESVTSGVRRRDELFVDVSRVSSKVRERFEMSPLLMVYFAVAAPVVGFGLVKLQSRLERWDYERHAED